MRSEPEPGRSAGRAAIRPGPLVWVSGLIVAPFWGAALILLRPPETGVLLAAAAGCLLAPVPGLLLMRRRQRLAEDRASRAAEEVATLKLQLETIRYRTARLREDLSAADRQSRLSHQLALLGQFTAGFMHEFNNPLSIVTGRIEVLLEERRDDEALCTDLRQMLQDARYMGRIAGTLLQALRRERGVEVYDPADPGEVVNEVVAAMGPAAGQKGVQLVLQSAEVPRVDLPGHVISEVLRGLVANGVQALQGRDGGTVWLRLDPYRAGGSKVVLKVEDNGPGVAENLQPHLFEPFVSRSPDREHLGLGLFLAASLVDMYDGRLRYEARPEGGASFVLELPAARFARGRPYQWFGRGESG